jgi:hypothetical protein
MDRDADIHGVLRAFDLESGKETSATPECKSGDFNDYADWTTPVIVSPKGDAFYLFFGSPAGCAQRWDAHSLQMTWSSVLPSDAIGSLDGAQAVFSDDSLYAANDSAVLVLGLSDGSLAQPISDPNYRFNVMLAHGPDVILLATRSRGTARDEIWAVTGATGQVHWKYDVSDSKHMDLGGIIDDNEPQWLATPTSAGLRVLRFKSASDNKSYAILQDMLTWDTGQSAGQVRTTLNLDTIILNAPDALTWKNDVAWMSMNQELMAFDANQNKITYQWP